MAAGTSSASAATPWWHLAYRTVPSHIPPGGEGTIAVQAINLGNAPTSGPSRVSVNLPADISLVQKNGVGVPEVSFFATSTGQEDHGLANENPFVKNCKVVSQQVSCSTEFAFHFGEIETTGENIPPLAPYELLEMRVKVKADAGAVSGIDELEASGGGTPGISAKRPVTISDQVAGFGLEEFSLVPEEEGGEVDTHAGTHPYQLATTLNFNRSSTETLRPPALPRNLRFKLPPGQVGNAAALPQCNDQDFAHIKQGGATNSCAGSTVIGVAMVTISTMTEEEKTLTVPIFNLTHATGEPARFGFEALRNPVILDTAVRSGPGEDYGVTVSANNTTQLANFFAATTVLWGAPADPSHNEARGWGCLLGGLYQTESGQECELSHDPHPAAFLTLPTNCQAPFNSRVEGNSWPTEAVPGGFVLPPVEYQLKDASGNPLTLTGCNQLSFKPQISAEPSAQSASSPSGLNFNLDFDDEGLTSANDAAQSQLKDTSVTLPEGLTINPSSGVGLGGCTLDGYAREMLESPAGTGCPNNSKLGTVEITTPLLPTAIHGSIFVAQPYENPFSEAGHPNGSLVALYIVAKSPETGVLIKLAGRVDRNSTTGQLTTTFQNNPQLPFDHFKFHFREGQQAPLITPPTCGSYATQVVLTPWSEPLQSLTEISTFQITSGVGGGACPAGVPTFTPQIEAGTVSNVAGAFSPFDLRLSRGDGESEITSFSTTLPQGLIGILTGIRFCTEQAIADSRAKSGAQEQADPSCPQASLLGHSQVGTGVGAVLAYTPGRIYLAGPYNGDPFSLVSVTSALVGPFDLGTVVVRFGLKLDPHTAQVSVDPSPTEPIPRIIEGIVTHVRDIRVSIDRANFTLNPTSCNPTTISSTLQSSFAQSATVTSPFQAASCQSLRFAPKFSVSTTGKTSKAKGAGLRVKLSYPDGPLGTYANLAKAKVSLPKQLPSRLTTLQKACTSPVFDQNPADCPQASIVGHAKVITQAIPEPLEGPAYFVSHGGEAFPDLTIVLKGYGVTIDLVGSTQIKNGITTSTFKATPDVPFNSFELTLPQGPNSALAANASLCRSKLTMPTEFTAQNGAVIRQSTPIKVTGCKKLTNKQRLAKALKQCRKKGKAKRKACERRAHRRFSGKGKGRHRYALSGRRQRAYRPSSVGLWQQQA